MKQKIIKYIHDWEARCYFNGIPDEVPDRINALNKAPSYKAIAIAILRNDYSLKGLGMEVRKSKLYSDLKRKELIERGAILDQKRLF